MPCDNLCDVPPLVAIVVGTTPVESFTRPKRSLVAKKWSCGVPPKRPASKYNFLFYPCSLLLGALLPHPKTSATMFYYK